MCFLADRTSTKAKTLDPKWDESFIHEIENASTLRFTVFSAATFAEDFVADCTIPLEDIIDRQENNQQEFWVSVS